ncbi:hypothetical protein ACH5RR_006656 [Cinchona calisaya]|uniref:Protein FAR1-RELATED SEQUENCE n=1 Tax=Cinchona calisaya TaxID=153742 RepID=A0ABD3APM3_9GENT
MDAKGKGKVFDLNEDIFFDEEDENVAEDKIKGTDTVEWEGKVMKITFQSEEEAYAFYNEYPNATGFSVRKYNRTLCNDGMVSVPFLRSHRKVTDADLAQAMSIRYQNIATYEAFCDKVWRYDKVGFITKDLYNKIDRERKNLLSAGDAEGAIAYLADNKQPNSVETDGDSAMRKPLRLSYLNIDCVHGTFIIML